MDISRQDIDTSNAIIIIKVLQSDYQTQVDKLLHDYRKKAVLPGFRPGLVPMSVVKSRYGKAVLGEVIDEMLSKTMEKYVRENNIQIVGNPVLKDNNLNLFAQTDFEFEFDIGLVPEFTIPLSPENHFNLYSIQIDDAIINEYIEEIRLRYGTVTHPEASGESDILTGDFIELDTQGEILPGGIYKSSAINIKRIPAEKSREKFIGRKEGESISLVMDEIANTADEIMTLLDIHADKLPKVTTQFLFNIKQVNHLVPAEVTQEWWDKVYGPGVVNNPDDFKKMVVNVLMSDYNHKGEKKLEQEIQDYLMKNTILIFPETFVKNWLKTTHKVKDADVDAQYSIYSMTTKWRLIENKIIKDNNITVSEKEIHTFAHRLIHQYYGPSANEEFVEEKSKRLLSNEKEVNNMYERLYEQKVNDELKKIVTVERKELPRSEFEKVIQ